MYLIGVAFLPSASWEMIRVLTRMALPGDRGDDVNTNGSDVLDSSRR
jgi:hypothetical protein